MPLAHVLRFVVQSALALLLVCHVCGQTLDTVIFGNTASESTHALALGWGPVAPASLVDAANGVYPSDPSLSPPSDVVTGGLGHSARRLLPRTPNADIYGGELTMTMAVDPLRQNHFTIKLWGSDASSGIWFLLEVEGKELGLRHGGDTSAPGTLFGNKQIVTFAPNQWVYRTVALPMHLTRGKTSVTLRIRSMGWISDYDTGPTFGAYNKLMSSPSLGLYRAYTHVGAKLDTAGEALGSGYTPSSPRTLENEETVIANIKSAINTKIAGLLAANVNTLKPWDVDYLAQCYDARENLGETWINYGSGNTASSVLQKVIAGIDYCASQQAITNYQSTFGNYSWGGGFGGLGNALRLLWPQLNTPTTLTTSVAFGGSYGAITRAAGWSRALRASVDHGRFNRRGGLWANQDFIGAEHTYLANRGLLLVDPDNALLESEALRYLREACGLLPWAGSDLAGGGPIPVKGAYPLGTSFYAVTSDGTTKDGGGFVGSDYGEMGAFAVRWGLFTGDNAIRDRGLQLLRARAIFRFPSFDESGYRVMQGTNPIGVRNNTLPGHYGYLDRDNGAPDIAALGESVIGHDLLGYFQQGIADGQQLRLMVGSVDPYLPRNWSLAKTLAATNLPVPMAVGAPDFAWADEENMVVAAKFGENRLFANLYWAAPDHIEGWAKLFHLPANAAPEYAEVLVDDLRYRPTGNWVTLGPRVEANANRQPFDNVVGAYVGTKFPTGYRSDLAAPPSSNPDAGKGTGYTLRYGHWLIAINAHHSDSYAVLLPSNFASLLPLTELVSGQLVTADAVTLAPKTSAVFYLPDVVDPAPRPGRPAALEAKSDVNSVLLNWDDAAGAAGYLVKRSTTSGSGYTTLATTSTSAFVDTTAAAGIDYFYVVSALSPGGLAGGSSPEATAGLQPAGLRDRTSGGTAIATLSAASAPAANAFDKNAGTLWASGSAGQPASLTYDFGAGFRWAVTRYDLTTSPTSARDPQSWSLLGSNDGATWSTLDTRSGIVFSAVSTTQSFAFANTAGFRYYRLAITAAAGGLGSDIALAELALFADGTGTVAPPATPTGLAISAQRGQAFLTWNPVAGASSYRIARGTDSSGPFVEVGATESAYFLDTATLPAGTYHYTVNAANVAGVGAPSSAVAVALATTTPTAPATLTATNGPGAGNVTLRWSAAPGVPTYSVLRSFTSGGPYTDIAAGIADTQFTDAGLVNGQTAFYVVTATTGGTESAFSSEASITPQSYAWSGTSANWSASSNWGGGTPGNGSLLIFSGTPAVTSTSNDLAGLTVSGVVFNAGAAAFSLSGNGLVLGGDILDYASNAQTIGLDLTLSGPRTIEVSSGQLTLSGAISDGAASYGITKTGAGILALTGANTFDGGLRIDAGTLQVGTSTNSTASASTASLGSASGTVTVGAATLRFQMGSASNHAFPQNFVFNNGATLTSSDGKITLGTSASTIAVNGGTLIQSRWSGKWFILGGVVSGSGDVSINNANSNHVSAVSFANGANSYTGTITVEDTTAGLAAVSIGHDTALQGAHVSLLNTVADRYALWFDTTAPVLGGLSGAPGSAIMLNTDGGPNGTGPTLANAAVMFSVGANDLDSLYEGNLLGSGGLTKVGDGVLSLAGNNAYTGGTVVQRGTLHLLTALSATSSVTVRSGGTLAGDVDLAGPLLVESGGRVSPGDGGSGLLTTRGLSVSSGATLAFDLGHPENSDQIALLAGAYSAPSSGQAALELRTIAGFGPGSYPLITGAATIEASQFSITTAAPAGYSYALNASGGTLTLVVTGPPPAPQPVFAYGSDQTVDLSWSAATGATTYTVYLSTSPTAGFAPIATTTTPAANLSGLTNGVTYYAYVVAANSYGSSAPSALAMATPQVNTWAATPTSLAWSLPANWGGAALVDHARLTFGASSVANLTNDLIGLTVGGMVFTTTADAYTLSGSGVRLTGDITNQSAFTQTIQLPLTLAGDRSFDTGPADLLLAGAIDDEDNGYGFTKNGSGRLVLSGANRFTGPITLNAGTLDFVGTDAAGTSGPLTLNGGTLRFAAVTTNRPLHVPAGATLNLVKLSGGITSLYGNLTGSGTILESGNANGLHWYGDNSGFSGSITSANSGSTARWRFNSPNAGSAAASWELNCPATDAYGINFGSAGTLAFGALSGTGAFRNDGAGVPTLRIGDLGTNTTFAGSTTGNIALLKLGSGTLTLAGTALGHTNVTTVAAGTLRVTGTITTSALTVQSGARLTGTGILGGVVNVNSGATLAPGGGDLGTLTITGTFAPKAGAVLEYQLGTSSDLITLGAAANFTAPSGGTATIAVSATAGFGAGTYTLINNTGSSTLTAGSFGVGSLPVGYVGTLAITGGSLQLIVTPAETGLTWSGVSSALLSQPANWGGTAPVTGDNLFFGISSITALTNDLTGITTGNLNFATGASAYTVSGSALRVGGNIVNNSNATQTFSLPLQLAKTINVNANTGTVALTGVLSENGGAFGINKVGAGLLSLSGANTFTGGVTLSAGTLQVAGTGTTSAGALGTGVLTLSGGTLQHAASTVLYNPIVATAGTTSSINEITTGNNLDLRGGITGSGAITTNAGANYGGTRLYGDNGDFTGTFTFNGGTSARNKFGAATSGSAKARWVLHGSTDSPSTLFGTGTLHLGELSGTAANIRNNAGGSTIATFSIGALNTNSTFSGVFSNVGTIALTKVGSGTLTLSGANTYSGITTVDGGTLVFTNTKSGTGAIQVNAAGTLAGTATVAGPVSVNGGTIAPGRGGVGTLTLSGAGSWTNNGTLRIEIDSTARTADQLRVAGATLTSARLSLTALTTTALPVGTVFRILDNTTSTAVSGVFTGVPEGGIVAAGPHRFALSYVGGTGNDIVLTALDPLIAFASTAGLTPATTGAANADPDNDGVENLLEWALGNSPTAAGLARQSRATVTDVVPPGQSAPIKASRYDYHLSPEALAYATVTVEASSDLSNWTPVVPGADGAWQTAGPTDANGQDISVYVPFSGASLYLRHAVTWNGHTAHSEAWGAVKRSLPAYTDNLVSPIFTSAALWRGPIAAISGNALSVDSGVGWTTGDWSDGRFALRVVSGALRGHLFTIAGNDDHSLLIDWAGLSTTSLANGDRIEIVRYPTLETLYPASSAGEAFAESASIDAPATEILAFDAAASGVNLTPAQRHLFINGAWVRIHDTMTSPAGSAVLPPDSHFLHRSRGEASILIQQGRVVTGLFSTIIEGRTGTKQDNRVAATVARPVTLRASGLVSSGAVRPSTSSLVRADEVLVFAPGGTGYNRAPSATYYYFNNAWRKVGASVTADFGDTVVLAPGEGFIVRKGANAPASVWTLDTGL